MKKKSLLLILFLSFISYLSVNCSSDLNESVIYNDGSTFQAKILQSDINIGYIDSNGNDLVYNDSVTPIKLQWEKAYKTTILSFRLEKQFTIPNPEIPGDQGGTPVYLLIGKTSSGSYIATSVEPVIDNSFIKLFLSTTKPSLTISCSGCYEGCHIATKNNKKGFEYLCSDPCSTCSKTETLTNAAPF